MLRNACSLLLCLGLLGAAELTQPEQVSAQQFCWECFWAYGDCYGCTGPAMEGYKGCEASCGSFCTLGPDCSSQGEEEDDLLALAAGTSQQATEAEPSLWVGDERLLGQVRRDCQGLILARYYPLGERRQLLQETRRLTL